MTSTDHLHDDGPDDGAFERPSKTAQKKAMHELQALGEALLELPDKRLVAIGLPERLLDAVREAQRITAHEGRRRQLQFVGKLMRQIDPEPVREAVAAFKLGHAKDALTLHEAERWRAELLASDDALTRWMAAHPDSDAQQLRALIRSARKEAQAPAAPGVALRQGRAFRELFQIVRTGLAEDRRDDEAPTSPHASDSERTAPDA